MAPKVFDVLRHLVENAGRLVSQQELLEAVWPETFVQPEILRKYIREIRKALGDPPDHPVFIETLPKRGYRFIAQVNDGPAVSVNAPVVELPQRVVGRDASMAELQRHFSASLAGQRRLVFVTGEGGIGKTTLLDGFEQAARREANVRVARGQCVEGFGGKESYYSILEAFGQLIAGPGGEEVVQMLTEHAPTWLVQYPSAIRAAQRPSLQQEILGATRERMLREACQVLEHLSASRPLVLLLEDLQWADESTLDLLSAAARRRSPAHLMILATYRPVDVILSSSPLRQMKQDLLVHRLCDEIALDPLSESDVERFLAIEFSDSGLPRSLATFTHRRSEGNPMFMVGIVDQLRQKGLLILEDGHWTLTAAADGMDAGVPPTLQQLLEIQIARLGPEERSLLGAACVAGQRFSVWATAAMLDGNAAEGERLCENLAARHSVLRRAGTQELMDGSEWPQYEFKHALYREVLYAQIPVTERRRLHARLAESMEALSPSAVQELASDLALHFEKARKLTRAVRYLILAAGSARRRYAHHDSLRLLRHALDLLGQIPDHATSDLRLQILERISDALYAQGEMMQSADIDRAAVEEAAQHGFVVAQVNSLTRLARALAFMDSGRCVAVCERAAELSRTQEDPLLTARAEMLAACWRMIAYGWRAEDAAICANARDAIRGNEAVPAYYEILYAHVQCIQGDFEGAYQTARAGIPKSIETDSLVVYLSAHSALVQALLNLGRFAELLEVLHAALEVAEKNRNAPWLGIFQANLAWARLQCGDLPGAQHLAQQLLGEHAHEPAGQIRAMASITVGFAELEAGTASRAIEYFSVVTAAPAGPQFFLDWHWRTIAQLGLSRALLACGNDSQAAEAGDAFFAAATSGADPGLRALALDWKARWALHHQNPREARDFVEKAHEVLSSCDIPAVEWRIETTAYQYCRQAADPEGAERHRARAAAIVDRLFRSLPESESVREYFSSFEN